jgi:hypothetical protein
LRDVDLVLEVPARVTVEPPPELWQRSPYTILGTLTFVLDRGTPRVHLVHHRRTPAGRVDPRRRSESRAIALSEFLGLVAEVEEVYRAWPSVWRRYSTEHALEVELGGFLVRTRAGLYAIYAKDRPFQPFVRDQESRDLLHEAAAFVADRHRKLIGGGFYAKCDGCGGEVRAVRSGRPSAPGRPRAGCGSRGSAEGCRSAGGGGVAKPLVPGSVPTGRLP